MSIDLGEKSYDPGKKLKIRGARFFRIKRGILQVGGQQRAFQIWTRERRRP